MEFVLGDTKVVILSDKGIRVFLPTASDGKTYLVEVLTKMRSCGIPVAAITYSSNKDVDEYLSELDAIGKVELLVIDRFVMYPYLRILDKASKMADYIFVDWKDCKASLECDLIDSNGVLFFDNGKFVLA